MLKMNNSSENKSDHPSREGVILKACDIAMPIMLEVTISGKLWKAV